MRVMHDCVNRLLALRPWQLLLLFFLLDLIAVFLYWLYTRDILESRFFRLARDRGFAETVQYGKVILVIVMLVKWRQVRPARVLSAWIVLFSVLVLDDCVGIHEEVGKWIEPFWPFPDVDGIRTKDLAEAVSMVALEGTALAYVAWNAFTAPRDLRTVSVILFLALCPLIFSSMGLDMFAHNIVEDLGEMISGSFLLGIMHWQFRVRGPAMSSCC